MRDIEKDKNKGYKIMNDGKKLDVNELIEQTAGGAMSGSDIMEVLEDID